MYKIKCTFIKVIRSKTKQILLFLQMNTVNDRVANQNFDF